MLSAYLLSRGCMSLSADAGVAALGLLMAFSNHRPQQPHTATSRVRKRAIFASILSLLLHEHLSKRLTYIERTASAIATATLAFASVDRPNDTLISLAHVCRIIRVLYGGYNSDGSLAIATGTLALTHAYLVWISLSQPLRERLCFWTSSIVYLDVCSVVCSVSSRSSKLDSHNLDDNNGYFASYASRSRHLVLSPTTRLFAVYGVIWAVWKPATVLLLLDAILQMVTHYRRVALGSVLYGIVSTSSNPNQGDALSKLLVDFFVWSILALAVPLRRYVALQRRIQWHEVEQHLNASIISTLLSTQVSPSPSPGITMDPREWIHRHSSGFVTAMARLSTCISLMLSQIFNLALVARLIGWRVSIPIAITFVYSVACKTIDWAISESLHDSKPQPQSGARLRFTTLVENIRAIKENGWESAFRPLANASTDANGQETRRTRAFYRIAAYLISLVGTSASQIASAVVVISHFQLSNDLSYIDVLLLVPAIESLTGSLSLVTRILDDVELVYQNSSLLYTLLRKDTYQRVQRLPETPDAGSSLVSLENCTFAWSPEDTHAGRERPVLSDVTLSVGQGEIVAVVGSLACGKSSLLSAICGLLPLTAGNGQVRGEIGLVEEHVWLAEDTFRANITLGHEFDEFRYWHAVETCSLSKVTQSWPLGDMEIVAGSQCRVEMSTGQRILLQLARTLYAQPDLVLIDDVFSVIDVQSRNAFLALWFADGNGQTSAPAMVMVTRSKRLASLADQLVHVSNGKVHVSRQKPVKWESLVLTSGSSSSSGTRLNGSPDAPESPGAESVLSDRTMLEGLSFYTQDRQQHQCKDGSGSSSPATPSASLPCWGSYLGRYMAISGYSWMLYTLGTQALSIYAAYQVDGYRMDLVIGGDKTVTMMQSLQSYLVVDALVGIAQQQLGNAERWIHQNAWAKRAKLAMQSEIVSSLIDTPASLVGSGTSRAELYQMLNADRDLLAVEIPRLLSQRILLLLRSCHSMAQVLRMSPRTVFVVAPLLMVYGIAVWWWRRRTSWAVSETANDPSYLRAAELRESILRGDRALRTMHSQARGHCKTKLGSLSALASHRLSVHYCIGFVEGVIGDICIESLPVIAALTLLAQRCLANEGVSPSDVDMAIRLTEVASLRLHSAFCIRDHSAAILAQALRRYFAFVSRSDKPAKPTSVSKEGLPNSDGGGIVMECKAFGIRYKQCTDPLLSNVSFTLKSGERLAIVGYDGTGKTALVRGILGLCPPCPSMVETLGAVHIYSALGAPATRDLHALVSIVHGDDPVLLEGTLRFSLDPLGQCADAEISSMVERTGLHELLGKHVELDSPTGALSTCQRKLVCLCRAILANRPVVVLDRLSAGMDTATQRKVHAVVRQELKKRVVLDITNQPGEISTSDGVLVVQDGRAEIVSLCPKEGV